MLVCLQVVDTEAFARGRQGARVDFDVNNLKTCMKNNEIDITIKHENEVLAIARDLAGIINNVRLKRLCVLKPAKEVNARIGEMQQRGWVIDFPDASMQM